MSWMKSILNEREEEEEEQDKAGKIGETHPCNNIDSLPPVLKQLLCMHLTFRNSTWRSLRDR